MKFPRASGILLHPTSLPGRYGIGEFGPEAFRFIDFLSSAGMKIWQVLPLNPTGYGDSPYQSFSAFAGNPLLISLERLVESGTLTNEDLKDLPEFSEVAVEFAAVIPVKFKLLRKAAARFYSSASAERMSRFKDFCSRNRAWLDDYALFMSAKDLHGGIIWTDWAPEVAQREPAALDRLRRELKADIDAYRYWQFEFFLQWHEIRQYCEKRGIRIMGDIPIYVAHDSADVWVNRDLFWLDDAGCPLKIAGVPPDYFSATGQLWGNPIYRWDRMKRDGYRWWIERFRATLAMFDMVRVDHFRGFEAYWEIPGGSLTSENGVWIKGPGAELFDVLTRELGDLPLVAENLGVITPEVEAIRHQFGFPGMAILQFAFSIDPQAPTFRPHNYDRELVAYTGGHDNDTMVGWWRSGVSDSTRTVADVEKEYNDAADYLGVTREQLDKEVNWVFIRQVMMSVANTVLFPMQDVLGLGSEARMNLPGSLGKNWKWRMPPGSLRKADQQRLRQFAEMYDR